MKISKNPSPNLADSTSDSVPDATKSQYTMGRTPNGPLKAASEPITLDRIRLAISAPCCVFESLESETPFLSISRSSSCCSGIS